MASWSTLRYFRKLAVFETRLPQSFGYVKNVVVSRQLHCCQILKTKVKISAKLTSDIEMKLESEEMKHRKHPGIRKTSCFTLPEKLVTAVDKVISKYDRSMLEQDVQKMLNFLHHRQTPLESAEQEMRAMDMMYKMNVQIDAEDEVERQESMKKMATIRKHLNRQAKRWQPVDYTDYVSAVYLATRLAQNYAAACKVFSEIVYKVPSFHPKTFFDFGSGVGSAVWAANTFWGSTLNEYFCVDTSAAMNNLSQYLLQGGEEDAPMLMKEVYFRQFLPSSSVLKYDLVVSTFSLLDLPSFSDRMKAIDILWQKTNDTLVIIENGGNTGFSMILDARDYILNLAKNAPDSHPEEVHVVAPCPHDLDCPLFVTKQICHFPVKYYPLFPKKDTCILKNTLISYVVLKKGKKSEDTEPWPRIIKPVLKKSKKVYCRMCCVDGKYREAILTKHRHGRHVYRCARKSSHGDLLPVSLTEEIIDNEPLHSESEDHSEDEECKGDN